MKLNDSGELPYAGGMARFQWLWLLCGFVAFGCDGGEEGLRATVGPEGGTVQSASEPVSLEVPPGALSTSVEIVIERIPVPAGYRAAGDTAYRFLPGG